MKASAIAFWCGTLPALVALPLVSCGAEGGQGQGTKVRSSAQPEAQPGKLLFMVGKEGLSALAVNGQSLLPQPSNGVLRVAKNPVFRRADGSVYTLPGDMPAHAVTDPARQTVTLTYAWGVVTCAYKGEGNRLNMVLSIENKTHDTLTSLTVQMLEAEFPNVPQATELDAGMFGMGGARHPLHAYPLAANPRATPPVLFIDYGTGAFAFCSDDPHAAVLLSVPYTTNPPAKTRYPLWVTPGLVAPNEKMQTALSLRFGEGGAALPSLAGDVLRHYAQAFPSQVHWSDHRAIGTLFLSSVGPHPATNPRGWFNNDREVDVTTPEGLARFRQKLLAYADGSIKILKGMNAQGMITWDPEGQEFNGATYYGDPRLTERLAPETGVKGEGTLACMDAFFAKFREAGLRVGVCIRPQEIRFTDGKPQQTDSPNPVETLKRKIEYARKRWGCTLFYVDSTVKGEAALDADVFRQVGSAFPDVLLMPENETLRYFAYSAPLNSFQHHTVTSTPPGARAVYQQAFSVLLAGEGDIKGHRAELVAAVRRGDILLFHGWWPNPNNAAIKSIYEEAAKPAMENQKSAPGR